MTIQTGFPFRKQKWALYSTDQKSGGHDLRCFLLNSNSVRFSPVKSHISDNRRNRRMCDDTAAGIFRSTSTQVVRAVTICNCSKQSPGKPFYPEQLTQLLNTPAIVEKFVSNNERRNGKRGFSGNAEMIYSLALTRRNF